MTFSGEFPRTALDPETHKIIMLIAPNVTSDGRTCYGFAWKAIARLAERWWNRAGRLEFTRLPADWRDPDQGVPSGITLAKPWADLASEERAKIITTFEELHVRTRDDVRESILEYMVLNHPDQLDQRELRRYLAGLPDGGAAQASAFVDDKAPQAPKE